MEQRFSLSQLNTLIKDVLFDAFPATVWVVGEISELNENRKGHCYLELIEKEDVEIIARMKATIWSYTYHMLKTYFETTTGQSFTQGLKILVQVTVEFHSSFGLSLNIKDIDPSYTVGNMVLQRKEIIERLKVEGVFDMNKELEFPLVPQRIAIISSKTAAGYNDFINQLENNRYGFRFYNRLFEVYMQGKEAVPSIISALEQIFTYEEFFDAVVIVRGGGAIADLSCFDNYDLAFNITQFPLPVITGIGHEKDDTIIDMTAHTRMKTPTAAAEFLIVCVEQFYERMLLLEKKSVESTCKVINLHKTKLESFADRLHNSVSGFIHDKNIQLIRKGSDFKQNTSIFSFTNKAELNKIKHSVKLAVSMCTGKMGNRLENKNAVLKQLTSQVIIHKNNNLTNIAGFAEKETKTFIQKQHEHICLCDNTARLLNPENVLKRGYTLTLKDGKIIKSAKDLAMGETIETRFADGNTESKIIRKQNNDN
ncbi:MAG: exodeoxyribonuclease VII large subunit [Bacteroidales bacterium]|jgi:exodeoxyribonuclease VII large subunit|nr:exodeoxyribonuclease VII large subunit [Bacteroidales bacterium]